MSQNTTCTMPEASASHTLNEIQRQHLPFRNILWTRFYFYSAHSTQKYKISTKEKLSQHTYLHVQQRRMRLHTHAH